MSTPKIYLETRIPAIDTLRVLAIIVLVFYHHFMIYVPQWGFHFKVDTQWVWLEHLMIVTSPWRMGLLWLISGIALSFMLSKMSTFKALLTRSTQLLFPLLIGVLVVVPPQLYVEMTQAGEMPLNYLRFTYALFFDQGTLFENFTAGIWPAIDVNHLWYLRSLWQYSVLAIVLFPVFTSAYGRRFLSALLAKPVLILLFVFAIVLFINQTQSGDSLREWYGFVWFIIGVLFGRLQCFWQQAACYAKPLAIMAIFSIISIQLGYAFVWKNDHAPEWISLITEVIYIANRTVMPIAILAIVYKWFNAPYTFVQRVNPLVFPLYIIHQTVSILVAYSITRFLPDLGLPLHCVLSTVIALSVCILLLILIKQTPVMHPFFGITVKGISDAWRKRLHVALLCCCVPIGFEIAF